MHFLINYELTPATRNDAQARFKAGGGLPPDDGVTMLSRWHRAGGLGGFVIAESASTVAIGKWMQEWTDLLTFTVSPILSDEEMQDIIG